MSVTHLFKYSSEVKIATVCRQVGVFHTNNRRPQKSACIHSDHKEVFGAAPSLQTFYLRYMSSLLATHVKQAEQTGELGCPLFKHLFVFLVY